MFKKVLVPLDGSETVEHSLSYLKDMMYVLIGLMMKLWVFLIFISVFSVPVFDISLAADGSIVDANTLEERVKRIEKKMAERDSFLGIPVQKAEWSGFIELDYDYYEASDISDNESGGTSDLGLGTVELALKVIYNEWVKSNVALRAEDVSKSGGSDDIFLDEAIFTLEAPWAPLYFTGGKTALPFGVFETRTISDTLTEEIYEVESVGAVFGFAPHSYGLDTSVAVYKGENIIENLEGFGTHGFRTGRRATDDVDSFIANVTFEPIKEILTFSAFYGSEPGDGNRNSSLGSALTLNYRNLALDAEYITALERELGDDGVENRENAWFLGLAFKPIEPLQLAARYEDFDDDRSGEQDGILDYRLVGGVNYSFRENVTLLFEYRGTKFEKPIGSTAVDWLNEFHMRLALSF